MALREVRLDIHQPIIINPVAIGHAPFQQLVAVRPLRIVRDGTVCPFTFEALTGVTGATHAVEDGVYTETILGRGTVDGFRDEQLHLTWVYASFKDRVYRQLRPQRATLALHCTNWTALRYPPKELFAMVSTTFSRI